MISIIYLGIIISINYRINCSICSPSISIRTIEIDALLLFKWPLISVPFEVLHKYFLFYFWSLWSLKVGRNILHSFNVPSGRNLIAWDHYVVMWLILIIEVLGKGPNWFDKFRSILTRCWKQVLLFKKVQVELCMRTNKWVKNLKIVNECVFQ